MIRILTSSVLGLALLGASVAVGSSALAPTAAMAQDPAPRIALVNLQGALNRVEEGQAARTRLERDLERRRQEFETAQATLQREAQEFEAAVPMLTQEAAMERYQGLQQRAAQLQQQYEGHQRDLARAEAEATEQIAERMFVIVQAIATERGYTMVLDRSTVVYAASGDDLTDELVRRYDAAH